MIFINKYNDYYILYFKLMGCIGSANKPIS